MGIKNADTREKVVEKHELIMSLKKRFDIPKKAVNNALARPKSMENGAICYDHDVRKERKDCKLSASSSYIYDFCHNENAGRAQKLDTAEYRGQSSTGKSGSCVGTWNNKRHRNKPAGIRTIRNGRKKLYHLGSIWQSAHLMLVAVCV